MLLFVNALWYSTVQPIMDSLLLPKHDYACALRLQLIGGCVRTSKHIIAIQIDGSSRQDHPASLVLFESNLGNMKLPILKQPALNFLTAPTEGKEAQSYQQPLEQFVKKYFDLTCKFEDGQQKYSDRDAPFIVQHTYQIQIMCLHHKTTILHGR